MFGMLGTKCVDELDKFMKDIALLGSRKKKKEFFGQQTTTSSICIIMYKKLRAYCAIMKICQDIKR